MSGAHTAAGLDLVPLPTISPQGPHTQPDKIVEEYIMVTLRPNR